MFSTSANQWKNDTQELMKKFRFLPVGAYFGTAVCKDAYKIIQRLWTVNFKVEITLVMSTSS